MADIKQRVAEFARDHHLFADGIRELDGIIEQASAEACAPAPYAELVANYPKLAERISQSDWETMPIAAQLEWALHQAEFQAGTVKAYADHVDGLRERIGLMEQRLAGATERKEAAEKRVAELEAWERASSIALRAVDKWISPNDVRMDGKTTWHILSVGHQEIATAVRVALAQKGGD